MMEAIARWICRGVALLLIGPLAASVTGGLAAIDGSQSATLLTGASLVGGVIALVVVWVCVVASGALSARLVDRHEAVLNIGFVLGWVAWTGGRLGDAYRLDPEAVTLIRVAVEGLLMFAVVVSALLISDRVAARTSDREGLSLSLESMRGALLAKPAVPAMVASVVLAVLSAWAFARHDGPGQALGSGFLGGLLAGVFGSLIAQSAAGEGKNGKVPLTGLFVPIVIGVLLAAFIAPLVGLVVPGAGKLLGGVARGSLPGWVIVSPSAWAAGAIIGVPAGISLLLPKQAAAASGVTHSA